jgi:uncharacterized membrane protein
MRRTGLSITMFCVTLLAGSFAYAQTATPPASQPSDAQKAQQQRMKDCNAEAAAEKLEGQKRKDFMKVCLSKGVDEAKKTTQAANAQQEKMKKCNADATAKKLKGDERKKFMSECLKAA